MANSVRTTVCQLCLSSRLFRLPASFTSICVSQARLDARQRCQQRRMYAVGHAKKKLASPHKAWRLDGFTVSTFEMAIDAAGDTFRSMTPAQYYDSAHKFFDAVQLSSNPWGVVYSDKHGVSADVLYETALILRWVRDPPNANALSHALWASASETGHVPSILTFTRDLIRSGYYGRVADYSRVEARFRKLVAQGKDPDALALEGELLFNQGKYLPALATLQRALQVGAAGFDWKPYCQLYLAKTKLKLQSAEEARDILLSLSELGFVEADVELGTTLMESDPEKAEKYLFAAARNGRPDMFTQLSQLAIQRAANATNEKAREELRRWALEWSKLGDRAVAF